jgi:membrane-bound serine protease (ClpP class)
MRTRKAILLTLSTFLLLSPIISFAVRALAEDTSGVRPDTVAADTAIRTITEDRAPYRQPLVYTMVVEGAIGAVTSDRVQMAIEEAEAAGAELLVIKLNTPGGFTRPTWTICQDILNSAVPVCVYVAPSGARAGSAGVYITYVSHFAAMAPTTNIGAAHPVAGGGQEVDSVMNEKITNDAVAQIRAAAERRGRNAEWAEDAVRRSVSITDREALEKGVIDIVAKDLTDLLNQIHGRDIEMAWGTKTMSLKDPAVRELKISLVHKILKVITDPDIAFILFSLGSLGILIELYNPGAILPGVVGAISLILAFYAFQTLPINYAGLALILLAIVLFIAEVKIVSHGLLTIGGVVSFFFGGLMLIDTVDPNLRVSLSVLITVAVLVGLTAAAMLWLVVKAHRHRPVSGSDSMTGKTGKMRTNNMMYVDGALWKVDSDEELTAGDAVEVIGMDKLILKVKKIESGK